MRALATDDCTIPAPLSAANISHVGAHAPSLLHSRFWGFCVTSQNTAAKETNMHQTRTQNLCSPWLAVEKWMNLERSVWKYYVSEAQMNCPCMPGCQMLLNWVAGVLIPLIFIASKINQNREIRNSRESLVLSQRQRVRQRCFLSFCLTLIYNRSSNMWILSYILHNIWPKSTRETEN